MDVHAVILCGGTGSRLWPLSREGLPKQFIKFPHQENSLFQNTIIRVKSLTSNPITIICNVEHSFLVASQLKAIGIADASIILEPAPRNTAPAIAVAALYLSQRNTDPLLLVLPSDHILEPEEFRKKAQLAASYAEKNHLVTFGINCLKPETAYGYIKSGTPVGDDCFKIDKFIEKPNKAKAEEFFNSAEYYWNSGMFCLRSSVYLSELQRFYPELVTQCKDAVGNLTTNQQFTSLPEGFKSCEEISIDNAVMEKTSQGLVVAFKGYWNDVGSWSSMWEAQSQDSAGNVIHGEVVTKDVTNSYLHSSHRVLTALGLKDVLIIETDDAILVANKDYAQDVKEIVKKFKDQNHSIVTTHKRVHRPWGEYEVLVDGPGYKVKRILVNPGCSLSLQMHYHRSEHWVVVQGVAEVTCDEKFFHLPSGESTFIPAKSKHRLANPLEKVLEIIETQIGDPLIEEDIVRFQDNYGRAVKIEEKETVA